MKRSNIDLFIPTDTCSGTSDLPQIEDTSKIEKYVFQKQDDAVVQKLLWGQIKLIYFPLLVK